MANFLKKIKIFLNIEIDREALLNERSELEKKIQGLAKQKQKWLKRIEEINKCLFV